MRLIERLESDLKGTKTSGSPWDALTTLLGASYPSGIYNLDVQLFQTTILGETRPLADRATRMRRE